MKKDLTEFEYVIPCEYDDIFSADDEHYILKKDGKFGAADNRGNIVIPVGYDYLEKFRETGFEPRFAAAFGKFGEKCGVIDGDNRTVVPFVYSKIDAKNSRPTFIAAELDGKFGGIDEKGNVIIPFEYEEIEKLRSNVFKAKKNGKYALIEKNGKEITRFEYDEIGNLSDEGLMTAKYGGFYGYITLSGQAVIGFRFKKARMFSDGIAPVIPIGKSAYEYIYTDGSTALQTAYDKVDRFSPDGLSYAHSGVTGKWGFINRGGRTVIPCVYDNIFWQDGKIIAADDEGNYHFFKENGRKCGGYDVLLPYREETEDGVRYGLFSQAKNGRVCRAEPEFEYIGFPAENRRVVKRDGKFGVIAVKGKAEIEPKKSEFEIEKGKLIKYNGNSRKVDIPNGVRMIESDAFEDCEIRVLNIPESVEIIRTAYFFSAEEINVSEDNMYFSSVGGAMYTKDKKTLLAAPNRADSGEFIVPGGTEEIGESAFFNTSINRVVLSEGVKVIHKFAFNLGSIMEIVLPNSLEFIGAGAFLYCICLEKVNIPPNVKYIGESAFSGCCALEEVCVPPSVTHIGTAAFPKNCKAAAIGDNLYVMKRLTELSEEAEEEE